MATLPEGITLRLKAVKPLSFRLIHKRLAGTTLDIMDILSDKNKKRCQAQLSAIGKTRKFIGRQEPKRKAAVLIPLCFVNFQPSIIFTLRSSKLRRHGGQISFPGGMLNDETEDTVQAALRESEEELGLPSASVDIWGSMLPLPDKTGEIQITPIIGNIGKVDVEQLKLNYDEVECVFTRDILSLCCARNFAQTTFSKPLPGGVSMPIFLGGEHKIWGLTAMLLHQTLSLIAPGMYLNRIRHPHTVGALLTR